MYRVVCFGFAGVVVDHVTLNLPKIRSSMLGKTCIALVLIDM